MGRRAKGSSADLDAARLARLARRAADHLVVLVRRAALALADGPGIPDLPELRKEGGGTGSARGAPGWMSPARPGPTLRFSSLAAVPTVLPSGLSALASTRVSWAGTSQICWSDGYDHRQMLLLGKPCVEKISLEWGEKMSDVTCDDVGRDEMREPVVDDQKWMFWSPVPPPVASRLVCQGHQARACGAEGVRGASVERSWGARIGWEAHLDRRRVVPLRPARHRPRERLAALGVVCADGARRSSAGGDGRQGQPRPVTSSLGGRGGRTPSS